MSRRKDRERYFRLKHQNPNYAGYRGPKAMEAERVPELDSVTCSVCQRKRNVPVETIPDDRGSFVCMRCREQPEATPTGVAADAPEI